MPTLGMDVSITLSTDKTRQTLDSFYRGIKVNAVQTLPYAYLTEHGDAVYNLEGTNFVLFIGDVYDGSDPFDVDLVNGTGETIHLTQTNFFMMNSTNLKTLTVKSAAEDSVGYKLYYG